MRECVLCEQPIANIDAPDVWKQVSGWVGGAKKDSMRLRHDTGNFAHGACINKAIEGVAPDQPSLFEEA